MAPKNKAAAGTSEDHQSRSTAAHPREQGPLPSFPSTYPSASTHISAHGPPPPNDPHWAYSRSSASAGTQQQHTAPHHPHSPSHFPPSARGPQLPSIVDRNHLPFHRQPPPSTAMISSEANSPSSDSHDSREDELGSRQNSRQNTGKQYSADAGPTNSADNSTGTSGGSGSNRRQRVHFSCTECHRRKQKCNRQTPCQHCIARKVPERCKTFQPGQDDNLDLTGRVNKLERTMEEGFDRIMAMLQNQARQMTNVAQQQPQLAAALQNQPSANLASSSAPRRPSTAAGSRTQGDTAGENSEGDEANDGPQLNASGGFHGSGAGVAMKIDSLLSGVTGSTKNSPAIPLPLRYSESGDLNSRMVEYGAADRLSDALMSSVPSKEICKELVEHYFKKINWLSPPLPERLVRPLFDAFIEPPDGFTFPPPLTTTNINVFACLMCLISISALSVESEIFPSGARARRIAARRYEWAGRRALLVSQVLGRDDVIQVIAFHLAWRFLMIDRRISEGWTCSCAAVHASFSIGLHRDGSKLGLEQRQTDLRRGIWWMVRSADYVLALNLGRPPLSDPEGTFSDTKRPSLEGLQHWWPYDQLTTHPNAKAGVPFPTVYQYGHHRIELTKICGKIVEIYQQIQPHHYSDVLALDAELLKAREKLPHYYQAKVNASGQVDCDISLDRISPMLLVHRFLMYSEYFMVRINLHRSYLLRSGAKGAGGQRFSPSRRACIESALEDLVMRDYFVSYLKETFCPDKVPMTYYIHIGTYSWFNSLLVASIASIIDPSMPEIPTVRQHLDRFLKLSDIKSSDPRAMELKDEMREREAKILAMFASAIDKLQAGQKVALGKEGTNKRPHQEDTANGKSSRPKTDKSANSSSSSLGAGESREEATADVLLGLGKANQSSSGGRSGGHSHKGSNASSSRNGPASSPAGQGNTVTQRSTPRGEASSPETSQSATHDSSKSHAPSNRTHSASNSTPTTYSNLSGDSPNSHVVDAAQADLNAWFQKEFVGGTFFDHSLNGLGLPDGSVPAGANPFDPQAGGDAAGAAFSNGNQPTNIFSARGGGIGETYGQGGFGREISSAATGTPINFGGYVPFGGGDESNPSMQTGVSMSGSGATQPVFPQQQRYPPVQWTTLPQPAWGGNSSREPTYESLSTTAPYSNPSAAASGGGASAPYTDSALNPAQGAAGGPAGAPSFDPNFWAELIDKIST